MRTAALSLVALCLGLMLASCGGTSVSKREFVARADAICASALRRTREIPPPTGTGTRALATYLDAVMPVLRSEARQLRGLRRPAADPRRQLTAFLSSFDAGLGHYAAVASAARRGDTAAVARQEAAVRAVPTAALAARFGLRVCGAAPSTAA